MVAEEKPPASNMKENAVVVLAAVDPVAAAAAVAEAGCIRKVTDEKTIQKTVENTMQVDPNEKCNSNSTNDNHNHNDNDALNLSIQQDTTSTTTTTTTPALADPPALQLSQQSQLLLQKTTIMHETYRNRAMALLQRAREGLPEEQGWTIPIMPETVPEQWMTANNNNNDQHIAFPDFATPSLAAIVEGRPEALTTLATRALETLNALYPNIIPFTHEAVTAKMKLLATRKNHVKQPHIVTASSETAAPAAPATMDTDSTTANAATTTTTNIFQDEHPDHLWRWEVTVLELLPSEALPQVKKARAAVRKLGAHVNAITKLLTTLQETEQCIQSDNAAPTPTTTSVKLEKLLARTSQEEEKVLKYEREAEKLRLLADARAMKDAQKLAEERQKQAAIEAKKQQALDKRKEADAVKQKRKDEQAAAKQAREDAETKQRSKRQALANKQKKIMSTFFVASTKKTVAPASSSAGAAETGEPGVAPGARTESRGAETRSSRTGTSLFDVQAFRDSLRQPHDTVSSPPFAQSLSHRARQSRKRRTTKVSVPVTVTVYPDDHNPFTAQPYAERQDLIVPNKCKFLSFKEDVRPPYYGTCRKTSTIITGRKPFLQDTAVLDYDVDSEAEWEEGDDEIGEDLVDDDPEKDDDGDDVMGAGCDDEDDGWLAGEVDDELDDETKLLRQKQLGGDGDGDAAQALKVCVIAPAYGGRPLTKNLVTPDKIEGYSPAEAMAVLERLTAVTISSYPLFLDVFPPSEEALLDGSATAAQGNNSSTEKSTGMPSDDNMRIFARFVHNCTLNSKDKIVDSLLLEHKTVTCSRSQAIRVLDSIAEKKKKPTGTVWEVKKEVLDSLGLHELIESKCDTQQEAMTKIALFVHHNTTSSKDKIVDDLRVQDESLTSSRAEAVRILQQIADKKKSHPGTGYYWSVKPSVRQELGLMDILAADPPSLDIASSSSSSTTTATASNAQTKTPVAPTTSCVVSNKSDDSSGSKQASSSSSGKMSSGKKRRNLGSTKLLESFIKKPKMNSD